MISQENIDTISNFPPLQKAVKLSTNLVCDRSASEVRACLKDLINSINKHFPVASSLPKRRASTSSKTAKHANATSTQNLTTKVPSRASSRAPSRTPTTPRYPTSPITPTTPTTPRNPTPNHKSYQTISDNNNSNTSKQVTKPCYWPTLYILTKICLIDLEYWTRGEGHPVDRISESFSLQPKILSYYKEVKSLDQRKLIHNILENLGKIQEVVLERESRERERVNSNHAIRVVHRVVLLQSHIYNSNYSNYSSPTPNHKSYQTILDNNNSNISKQVTKPCYWPTLYILTKICLMDLEYWKRDPVDRISESFFLQPKILSYYKEVKSLDQRSCSREREKRERIVIM